MKEKKSNIGKYLLILVPFVMGVTGFTVLDGQPVVDSLFLSMEMYFLNYSDSPPNILIEIARWTAQRSISGAYRLSEIRKSCGRGNPGSAFTPVLSGRNGGQIILEKELPV